MSKVRIVGGQWRSRLIEVARVPGLRPTPDRVRETLFNWLGQTLNGMSCLDLFAGSGVLGFEAASRGCGEVVMVERDAGVLATLKKNKATLSAAQVELVSADALKFLHDTSRQFDIVFLDPPYKQGWLERVEPHIKRVLRAGGWLYAEAETPLYGLAGLKVIRHGKAGQVCFHLLREEPS